jgi:hypothetical protein
MRYIESPTIYEANPREVSLFLAGGITGCPDWQSELVDMLKGEEIALFNPRRKNYPKNDPDAEYAQIRWEHDHLRKADAISFWFPQETLCPITLYELGAWSMTDKTIFIGVHPEYQKKSDVLIQTGLVRPEIEIAYNLESIAEQIKCWSRKSG